MTSAGIDFGTSNSAAAVPGKGDEPARVLDIDESAADRRLLRSVLFFPDGSADILAGALAIEKYLEDFEGRFLQSIKTFLPSTAFTHTEIRRKTWKLEQLIAALLSRIRESVERELHGKLSHVVFGRPAVFSPDPEKDALAQGRLAQAAVLAGFPEPVFVIEPIAAALRYEESLSLDEVVLVGDFGAGTSDFTLMQLGPSRRRARDRRTDVIASSGVYVGGDKFDAAIVQHRLLAEFGAGSTYSTLFKRTELPHWMTRKLLAWNELSMLREKSNLDFLRNAVKTSDKPRELQNLVTLAEENLPFHLYRVVEEAKRNLSDEPMPREGFRTRSRCRVSHRRNFEDSERASGVRGALRRVAAARRRCFHVGCSRARPRGWTDRGGRIWHGPRRDRLGPDGECGLRSRSTSAERNEMRTLAVLLLFALPAAAKEVTLKSILLEQLRASHDVEEWYVPVSIAVAGLTPQQAAWTDKSGNHSVGQLANHLLFWNRRQLAKFNGEEPDRFSGNNDETFNAFDEKSWAATVQGLDQVLTAWEKAVEAADEAKLRKWASTIAHIGTHNAYHTGQIVYVRKLQGSWDPEKGVKG